MVLEPPNPNNEPPNSPRSMFNLPKDAMTSEDSKKVQNEGQTAKRGIASKMKNRKATRKETEELPK